jgi:uncharacterized phage-associated protein
MKQIRFRFSPTKALAALSWMLQRQAGADLHTILKGCYFADKKHLNQYGRPIFGATYRAMKFGPVPLEIYEMAKGEAIWLAELGLDRYPWHLEGYRLHLVTNDDIDLSVLPESDMDAIRTEYDLCSRMTFNARTAVTHGKDWQAANLGIMRYEDMLDESPQKAAKVAYLRESAPFIRL